MPYLLVSVGRKITMEIKLVKCSLCEYRGANGQMAEKMPMHVMCRKTGEFTIPDKERLCGYYKKGGKSNEIG